MFEALLTGPGEIAVAASLLTASATAIVGFALEGLRRHREKQAMLAALASEILTLLRIARDQKLIEQFREVIRQREQNPEAPWPASDASGVNFPPTIYEKCADRIGILGAQDASDIIEFYNMLSGFRSSIHRATTSALLPVVIRTNLLKLAVSILATNATRGEDLGRRLRAQSERGWLFF